VYFYALKNRRHPLECPLDPFVALHPIGDAVVFGGDLEHLIANGAAVVGARDYSAPLGAISQLCAALEIRYVLDDGHGCTPRTTPLHYHKMGQSAPQIRTRLRVTDGLP